MKMKKYTKLIIMAVVIVLIIISAVFIKESLLKNNKPNEEEKNKEQIVKNISVSDDFINLKATKINKLSNYLKKYNNVDDITGLKIDNNKFILELNDTLANDITFITKYLLIYDIDKDEVKEIKYNGNDRIWDVAIFSGKIYYSSINYDSKADKTSFKIIESDLNLKNKKVLEQGQVSDALFSPKLISTNDAMFYAMVDDYKDATSSYSKFNLKMLDNNSNITELTSGFYDYGNQTGTTFTSMSMFKVYNNNVYYEIYNNGVAKIKKYDILKKISSDIYSYEIKDDSYVINDFYDSENYKFYTYKCQTILSCI